MNESVAWPFVVGEVLDRATHLLCEVLGRGAGGEAPEVRRERSAPVHADRPRPALVREEDHVVVPLVDMAQQTEEQLERLAQRWPRRLLRGPDALADQPIELGDELLRSSDACMEVLELTAKLP